MGYILFNSEKNIYIQTCPIWDGIIEYSYDNNQWDIWYGDTISNNKIYMRGINNTFVSSEYRWIINGTNIKCQGNIENLLDYRLIMYNVHPKMEELCFAYMFLHCKDLIEAPQLLSVKLSDYCYRYMFYGCASLITSPLLPNIAVAQEAIINQQMLDNCSTLTTININNKLYDINFLKLL